MRHAGSCEQSSFRGYDQDVANESAPYGIVAAAFLIVGASAAISVALGLGANAEPAVAVAVAAASGAGAGAGGADAGAVDASPALSASARMPLTEREDSGAAAPAPSASASAKPAASDATEANGPGFLTIVTTPSAKLSVHGRVLCTTTPCSKLALPPGQHTLTLENKEDASKTIVTVTIISGETTVKRVKLKTAPPP